MEQITKLTYTSFIFKTLLVIHVHIHEEVMVFRKEKFENALPWSAMTTMLTQLWRPLWYNVSINRDSISSTFFSWSLTPSLSGPPPCPAWSGSSKYKVMKSGFSSSGKVSQLMTSYTLSGNPTLLLEKNDKELTYVWF